MCGRSEWAWRASGVSVGAAVTSFLCDFGYVNEGCGGTRFTVTVSAAAALMMRQAHRIASVILLNHHPQQLRGPFAATLMCWPVCVRKPLSQSPGQVFA